MKSRSQNTLFERLAPAQQQLITAYQDTPAIVQKGLLKSGELEDRMSKPLLTCTTRQQNETQVVPSPCVSRHRFDVDRMKYCTPYLLYVCTSGEKGNEMKRT
jgi:hypothetical protein